MGSLMPIDTPHPDFNAWQALAKKCSDAEKGEEAIKAGKTKYLNTPFTEPTTERKSYTIYSDGAKWFPATSGLIRKLMGAVFRKEVVSKEEEVVIYACGAGCGVTARAVATAVSMGFKKVYFFRDGFPGWKAAGHPVEVPSG